MIESWYSTPIYSARVNNFIQIQEDFEQVFLDIKNNQQFQHKQGWGKNTHLLNDTDFTGNIIEKYQLASFATELKKHILEYISKAGSFGSEIPNFVIAQSWMTLTLKGQFAHKHAHGHADLSGAYYFKTNGRDGDLYFEHPNRQLLETSIVFNELAKKIAYKPEEGRLVLFPGWMEHGVFENTTDSERVSVSFNVYFERLYKLNMF